MRRRLSLLKAVVTPARYHWALMRRLLRWSFNLSAAVSTVLCVGICVLWARSRGGDDCYIVRRGAWGCSLASGDGAVSATIVRYTWYRSGGGHARFTVEHYSTGSEADLTGFGWFISNCDDPISGVSPTFATGSHDVPTVTRGQGLFNGMHPIPCPPDYRYWRAGAQHWLAATALSALPAFWLFRRIFSRRRQAGLCPTCGYDLRATPDRCPECGAVPARKAGT